MNDQDEQKIIQNLQSATAEPDFNRVVEKAAAAGPLPWDAKRKWRAVAIPVFSTLAALAIAIPTTWAMTKRATQIADLTSQQGGAAQTTDVEKYLSDIATYHYGSAIGTLMDSGVIYADLYYAFNSKTDNYVVVANHGGDFQSVSGYIGGSLIEQSRSALMACGSAALSNDWTFVFLMAANKTITISITLDLEPYYNSVMRL